MMAVCSMSVALINVSGDIAAHVNSGPISVEISILIPNIQHAV